MVMVKGQSKFYYHNNCELLDESIPNFSCQIYKSTIIQYLYQSGPGGRLDSISLQPVLEHGPTT